MEPEMYERIFRLQSTHWWHKSRMRFMDVLMRHVPRRGRILDVGCGPGSMLHYLGKYGEVVGVDSYFPALEMAKTHFCGQLLEGNISQLPFAASEFSLVAACEVLYHRNIADVQQAVNECVRVLQPGGHLVVVDSAYSVCFSAHDQAAHGVRRFNKAMFVKSFQDAGLEIVHVTYAYSLLLPVVLLVRKWKALCKREETFDAEISDTWKWLNAMVIYWFTLEAFVAGRWGLSFGLSVQIMGRKPKE